MLLVINSIFGFFSLISGILYAHLLSGKLQGSDLSIFTTAMHYHQAYSFLLVLLSLCYYSIAGLRSNTLLRYSICTLTVGYSLFCFSLYLKVTTHFAIFNILPPFGGVVWVLGWVLFIIFCIKWRNNNYEK